MDQDAARVNRMFYYRKGAGDISILFLSIRLCRSYEYTWKCIFCCIVLNCTRWKGMVKYRLHMMKVYQTGLNHRDRVISPYVF